MSSIIEGYNYDIFISYRQKDNKGDKWVSEFVEAFRAELESTFKEEISVYFDINPHDGLLETHDVDASLKEKLKCLVFIPIISRTYCDPKSFAWEHEFIAFVEQASHDQFGLKVKLPNGNIASRVLPVRIHDLDNDDIKLCESILGGFFRGVELIYKSQGVNRPLRSKEDKPHDNLNKTIYRDQINKVANAIKEIISGMRKREVVSAIEKPADRMPWEEIKKEKKEVVKEGAPGSKNRMLITVFVSIVSAAAMLLILIYPKIFKRDSLVRLRSSGEKISVAVMPFQNMTNDTTWNVGDVIQQSLIYTFVNTGELRVRLKETIDELLNSKGLAEYASISPETAVTISKKLDTDLYIYGSIQKEGSRIKVITHFIDTKTREVLKSFREERPAIEENISSIGDSLGKKVIDFLRISKLIKENQTYIPAIFTTNSPEALRYYISGIKAQSKFDLPSAIDFYLRAIKADSNFLPPKFELVPAYKNSGKIDKSRSLIIDLYRKKDQMSPIDQLITNYRYAEYFEPPGVRINYLKQLVEIDDQGGYHYQLARAYGSMNQPDKAISELEKALDIFRKWGKEFLKEDLVFPALGEAYLRTGQYKKARKIYSEAERVNDDHTTIYFSWIIRNQAALSLTEGDSVAANKYIEELKSVLKENSLSEADIDIQLATMYKAAGNLGKAEEYARRIFSLDPDNPDRMNDFAWFLIDMDRNITEGMEIIDKALLFKPDNYKYLDTKGWGLYKQGKYNEALELLEKSRDLYKPYYSYGISNHIDEVKKAIANQAKN